MNRITDLMGNIMHSSSASVTGVAAQPSTTAGESTASESGKHTRALSSRSINENTKEVLELKFPRCCVCGVDWYDMGDEGGDKKPSASGLRTSPTKLYPLPQCQCNIKLSLPFNNKVQSIIWNGNDYTHNSPQDVLNDIHIHKFKHIAVCRPCLEKKIETSEEVLTKDYQQNGIANGQRDVKYSIPLKCDFCSQKFMKRKMDPEKLKELGRQSINVRGGAKGSKKGLSWFDSVDSTIRLVGWMKRQKRRARRDARRSTMSGEGKEISQNWWAEAGCLHDSCSSDECYSLSSDSDFDDEKKPAYRQIAKRGEIAEEYQTALRDRDNKRRQQVQQDEEFAKKILAEIGPTQIDEKKLMEIRKQQEADEELAKKLQEEEKAKSTPSHRDAKRKADTQPINNYFSKQSKTEQNSSEAKPKEYTDASTAAAEIIDLVEDEELESNVTDQDQDEGIESNIAMLMEMGYTRQQSKDCLKSAKNDMNLAASMLLSAAAPKNEKMK